MLRRIIKKPPKIKNMDNEVFLKEIAICKKMFKKNGGRCKWGECDKCGVIPLLYKLGRGEVLDDKADILRIKNDVLK
jgi:hypothetical protein